MPGLKNKNSKTASKKIEKRRKVHKTLDQFKFEEEKRREEVRQREEEIFEHLKNHTKKMLKGGYR